VAIKAVYLFPASGVIDERYVEQALPVIHEQLAKAAVRLAGVLNQAVAGNLTGAVSGPPGQGCITGTERERRETESSQDR